MPRPSFLRHRPPRSIILILISLRTSRRGSTRLHEGPGRRGIPLPPPLVPRRTAPDPSHRPTICFSPTEGDVLVATHAGHLCVPRPDGLGQRTPPRGGMPLSLSFSYRWCQDKNPPWGFMYGLLTHTPLWHPRLEWDVVPVALTEVLNGYSLIFSFLP